MGRKARKPQVQWREERRTWRVRFYINGKRQFRTFKAKKEADAFAARLEKGYAPEFAGMNTQTSGDIDLFQAARRFLAMRKGRLAHASLEAYGNAMLQLIHAVPEGTRPNDITADLAETFLAGLLEKGLQATSINNYRRHLCVIFAWFMKNDLASQNSWASTEPYKVQWQEKPLVPPDKVQAYLQACPESFRPAACLGVFAGLRKGEVLRLDWKDIDLSGGSLVIRQAKSGKPRRVPLHPHLKQALAASPRRSNSSLLFPKKDGGQRHHRDSWLTKVAGATGRKIGLEHISFHSLRRTCATLLAANGVSETAIRDILGHHDTTVTRVYLGLGMKELKTAMERVAL